MQQNRRCILDQGANRPLQWVRRMRHRAILIVLGEAIRADFGRGFVCDEVRFGILDVQEVGTENKKRDNLALQLGKLRRGKFPLCKRVQPDDAGGPRSALKGKSAAESLESGRFNVTRQCR